MRGDLPTGTVTFLFTDVEGSTRLLHELGAERYAEALAQHRQVVREACIGEGGVEVDNQGDAFFFAFPSAPGALAAASAFTEALASGPIAVRVGLHTGTPLLTDEGYVGGDVHRAARIAACGHGAQVLVSASTASLVELELTDLGEHRLKDLSAPERMYQLGEGEFPALKSLYHTNLPVPATAFLGREAELAEVLSLISSDDTRLLTLTGPGGTGKTRLALQAAGMAADAYPDGVWWVPLAPLRDPALVLETAAHVVGSKNGLAEHIQDKSLLCLFDNFEQVVEAAPDLSALLSDCPNLDILVTSRERLRVGGEQTYPVPPLAEGDGESLFVTRARAVNPSFVASEAVRELCLRLDELPLALELAAARTALFSPGQLLERLSERLDLLKGERDADPRQQTLRATIEWSYDLLSEEEQALFARLSVFAGGCTYEAAEQVADAEPDTLQSLLDKSLLRKRESEAEPRYWMLETIREYAAEQLKLQDDGDTLSQRHADYFLRLAEQAEPHLTGAEQARWMERLETEHENLRLSLDSLRRAGLGAEELGLVGALMRFWYQRGHLREGSRRCEDALAAHDDQSLPRVKALFGACLLAHRLGDYERADVLAQERLELSRLLGDPEGIASSLVGVGVTANALGDDERAVAAYTESADLARAGGYTWILAMATANLGALEQEQEEYAHARVRYEESLALFRQVGDERFAAAALCNLGSLAAREGRNDEAEALLHESLEGARVLVDKELAIWCLEELAALAVFRGDGERAAKLTGSIETLREETGHVPQPGERRLNEQTRAALASERRQELLAAALALGRKMTFEEVVGYALHT
jgi:predicted ATPase